MSKVNYSFISDAAVEETFKNLDVDHNGRLNKEELIAGLKKLSLPHEERDVLAFMNKADTNHDGEISLEEFKEYVNIRRRELKELFDSLDTNKNGSIEYEEFRESLKKLNIISDDDFVKKLIRSADKNQDGTIAFDEWLELLVMVPEVEFSGIVKYWEDAAALWSDIEVPFPTKKEENNTKQLLGMAVGAFAGVVAKTITAPLERLKVIYQIQSNPPPMWVVIRDIWRENGIKGFFRSNGANLIKIAPEMAFKFWSFEVIKNYFSEDEDKLTNNQRFLAGGIAGAASHTIVYPLDVIKTRMAATSGKHAHYSGIMTTAKSIAVNEGYFSPFFRGWTLMVMGALPSNALTLGLFSVLKHMASSQYPDGQLTASGLALCSTASSLVGSVITYPLGVIKSRLQVQGIPGHEKNFDGLFDAVKKTWTKEGVLGFYRGMVPTLLKHVPSQTIAFMTYDLLRTQLGLEAKKKKH